MNLRDIPVDILGKAPKSVQFTIDVHGEILTETYDATNGVFIGIDRKESIEVRVIGDSAFNMNLMVDIFDSLSNCDKKRVVGCLFEKIMEEGECQYDDSRKSRSGH